MKIKTLKFFWYAHKWTGIILAIVFTMMSVTGFLLLVKKYSDEQYGKAVQLLQHLLRDLLEKEKPNGEQRRLMLLIATAAVELNLAGKRSEDYYRSFHGRLQEWLCGSLAGAELQVAERAEAGRLMTASGALAALRVVDDLADHVAWSPRPRAQ